MSNEVSVKLIALCFMIFVLGIAAGFWLVPSPRSVFEEVIEYFRPFIELPAYMLAIMIFVNNFLKTLILGVLLGLFIGIPPVIFVFLNGLLIGLTCSVAIEDFGVALTLASILPHGVLEIPALLISSALGIRVGLTVYGRIKRRVLDVKGTLKGCVKAYFKIAVPLLMMAAVIEVYITPLVMDYFIV